MAVHRARGTALGLSTLVSIAWVAAASLGLLAGEARANVPTAVHYQGLLLDEQGDPVQGSVDLVFTIYDALVAGDVVWTETHPAVPVLDGIYDVSLGETVPLAGSVFADGSAFLEITVDGETLSPRQQFLSVPYALRAASADDVGGAPAVFVNELFENFAFDGADPPNDDPSEGFADPDGNGLVNFLDPDNDGDGLDDAAELTAGSDINLVTPTIVGFTPTTAESSVTSQVTIAGTGFEPGMAVTFGSESPTPQNVTATSLDVQVGPQAVGTASVALTRANGESATSSFDFVQNVPAIGSLDPPEAPGAAMLTVTIAGSGFAPGLEVSFGSENPAPQNLTPTSFDVMVGGQTPGFVAVEVSYPSGQSDSAEFLFTGESKVVFVTSQTYDSNLGGLSGADAECNALAGAASLPGSFLAWLGDDTGDPQSRFSKVHPYLLANGTPLATSFGDLVTNGPDAPIGVNESGAAQGGVGTVWTGTGADGFHVGDDCSDWTDAGAAGSVAIGTIGTTSSGWTHATLIGCGGFERRLYCFEQ